MDAASLTLAAVTAVESTAEVAGSAAGTGATVLGLDLTVLLLLLAGVVLVLLETVVPGGLLGAVAVALFLIATVMATRAHGGGVGLTVFAVSLVACILAVILGWSILPNTKWGQRLFLTPSVGDAGPPGTAEAEAKTTIRPGDRGESVSFLRPAGMAKIGQWRVDVVTRGEYVEQGAPVEVVALDGTRIVVRELRES